MVEKLNVFISLEGVELEVGQLASMGKAIYFQYNQSFVETKLNISPFKIPFTLDVSYSDTLIFEGLFGAFADSLPDGWGRMLMDKFLLSKNYFLNEINPLLRLALVGEKGNGAIIYRPVYDNKIGLEDKINLDEIYKECVNFNKENYDDLDSLYQLGGSSGGARPKIWVKYNDKTDKLKPPYYEGDSFKPWIIKFPASTDFSDIAHIEYAYYKMAIDAGIVMNKSKLFESKSGKYFFGTKRFDANEKGRLHMISAAALLHDNYRLSGLDYGHLMDAAFKLANRFDAYEHFLRLAVFNVLSQNRDDHSKNFSFLMNSKGDWQTAPAYDLTFSTSSHGYHSTTIAGEGKNPSKNDFVRLSKVFNVKSLNTIITDVSAVTQNWTQYAKEAGVSKKSTKTINDSLKRIYLNFIP